MVELFTQNFVHIVGGRGQ